LLRSPRLIESVAHALDDSLYAVIATDSRADFCQQIEQDKQILDCLILEQTDDLRALIHWLYGQATLLPVVILAPDPTGPKTAASATSNQDAPAAPVSFTYHNAEVHLAPNQPDQLPAAIEQAIRQFLELSPTCRISTTAAASGSAPDLTTDLSTQNFLLLQQRRMTEKLKERLGYLGVYYKRSPKNFLRNLLPEDREELLAQFKADYRGIVLSYFADDGSLNQRIDDYVNSLFFADIAVSKLVEIHMELMDDFAKQLQIEGRSEEVLMDYRLTLIDVIAHLCEMYRRSIPRDA
jgi:circadian clock protein KaiA